MGTVNNILLSIIVPVYNVENVLNFCVESIFSQDLDPKIFEVLLINDGSKDNSYDVCLELQKKYPNISVFSQENSGQSVARNRGIEEAKGTYLCFIDSDDYLLAGGLNKILDLALAKDLEFIGYGNKGVINRNIEYSNTSLQVLLQGSGLCIIAKYNYNNGPWWYIYKKENFENLRFMPNRLGEDGLFTAELLLSIKNGMILDDVLYCYVDSPESTVNTKNKFRQIKLRDDMFFVANEFNKLLKSLPNDDENYLLAYSRLKKRQESYLFFSLVRSIRTHEETESVMSKLRNASGAYPIRSFDGYNSIVNRLLIKIFNNKFLLSSVLSLNNFLKVVK